jgi:hypothetical protein
VEEDLLHSFVEFTTEGKMNPKMMESFGKLVAEFDSYLEEMTPEEFAENLGMQVAAIVFSTGVTSHNLGAFVGKFIETFLNRMSSLGVVVIPASAMEKKIPMSGLN